VPDVYDNRPCVFAALSLIVTKNVSRFSIDDRGTARLRRDLPTLMAFGRAAKAGEAKSLVVLLSARPGPFR
jgi:hypothetical protein